MNMCANIVPLDSSRSVSGTCTVFSSELPASEYTRLLSLHSNASVLLKSVKGAREGERKTRSSSLSPATKTLAWWVGRAAAASATQNMTPDAIFMSRPISPRHEPRGTSYVLPKS